MNPTSFETSWTEGEKAAFAVLLAATGSESGRSGFLGHNPGIANAWHFNCTQVNNGGEVFYAGDIPSICIPAYAECQFLRRSDCQKWAMRIASKLPVDSEEDDSNLVQFRLSDDGIDEIRPEWMKFQNDEKERLIWKLKLKFELVFSTGGKANSIL